MNDETNIPLFAVVGHVNKGKSSIVATLSEDDTVAVAHEARTTRHCREYPFRIDGRTLFVLIDTPGFEQARHALEWMRRRESSALERPEIVEAFLREHASKGDYPEECELLRPIVERGAGILYVVDGSRPYGPEYEAEMEILRWTGQPRLAIINTIGRRDCVEQWRVALDQYFSLVRVFDAHRADFEVRLQLLRALRELREESRGYLNRAIEALEKERESRKRQSARVIAEMLGDMMDLTIKARVPDYADIERHKSDLLERYRETLRKRERLAHDRVEDIYQHGHARRRENDLDFEIEDLFSETTWLRFGLDRKQLAMAAAAGGALAGGGIDASVGGASFFLGAIIGGATGALSGWLSKGSLSKISIKGIRMGGRALLAGPMRDRRFTWVVLDRALFHHRTISRRAHARRDEVVINPADSKEGVVSSLSADRRRKIEACLADVGKARSDEAKEATRAELAILIEALIE